MADLSVFPAEVLTFFKLWKTNRRNFKILVIGDCGSGKTTLVNNLLGQDVAQNNTSSNFSTFHGVVQGVPITVHETSGLGNSDPENYPELEKKMASLLEGGLLDVIVYCFKLSETRFRASSIDTLQLHQELEFDWSKTVFAWTFSDALPIPKSARKKSSFSIADYFNVRVDEMKQHIKQILVQRIGVLHKSVEAIQMAPTTDVLKEMLPNQKQWYAPFWSCVLLCVNVAPQPKAKATDDTSNSSGNTQDYAGKTFHFVESPPEWLMCAVCQAVCHDPVQVTCCGKIYCSSCIERWKATTNSCPTCRSTEQSDPPFSIFKDRNARQRINSLAVYCLNRRDGCSKVMDLVDVENHLILDNGCSYQAVECSNKCGHKEKRATVQNHIKNHCRLRPVKCEYCPLVSSHEIVTGAHLQKCPNYPLACPNKCGAQGITRSTVPTHREVCPLQQVECEFKQFSCAAVMHRKDVAEHLKSSVQAHLQMTKKRVEEQEVRLQEVEATLARLAAGMK